MNSPLEAIVDQSALPRTQCGSRERKEGSKRKKYTARACEECKRRKVKCSGEDSCQNCSARGAPCQYSSTSGERPNGRGSVARHDSAAVLPIPEISWAQALTDAEESIVVQPCPPPLDPPNDFNGLCNRVKALERMIGHLLESYKEAPRFSDRPGPSPPSNILALDDGNGDNMFLPRESGPDDLSLSSQVAAMGAFLSKPPSPGPSNAKTSERTQILVELPDPVRLKNLLDVYFCDFDAWFPFLNRTETEPRILGSLESLGYSSYNRILVVANQDLSLIAMACVMLAMAECLDSHEDASEDVEKRPGWNWYLQGSRAMERLISSNAVDLDVVRAQCIKAAYLMHSEVLRSASEAVSVAQKLAIMIKLNDQRAWNDRTGVEIISRQQLWWTIYFLDRRIAQKSGISYHIRDTEFYVEDFKSQKPADESRTAEEMAYLPFSARIYLQALIDLARLWSHVWDSFFAIGATRKGDWLEVEIMDTHILNTRRQLPEELSWSTEKLPEYALRGESATHLRRRLQIATRIDLLRMIIRQNPIRQTAFVPETAYLCSRIARETISAHVAFMARYPCVRAVGYFTTASMVECVYHLVPVLHYSKNEEQAACVKALNQAHGILIQFSAKLNVAKRALKALHGVTSRWGTAGNTITHEGAAAESVLGVFEAMDMSGSQMVDDTFHMDPEQWVDMPGDLFGSPFEFGTGVLNGATY